MGRSLGADFRCVHGDGRELNFPVEKLVFAVSFFSIPPPAASLCLVDGAGCFTLELRRVCGSSAQGLARKAPVPL